MPRGAKSRGLTVTLQSHYNLRSIPETLNQPIVTFESGQRSDIPVGTDNMASGGVNDDLDYVKSLEDELVMSRKAREEETKLLQTLISRMDLMDKRSFESTLPTVYIYIYI